MRIPWLLSNLAFIPYNSIVYYSFCLEIVILPIVHFANDMPWKLIKFQTTKEIRFSVQLKPNQRGNSSANKHSNKI